MATRFNTNINKLKKIIMKLNKRELEIVKCALNDYHFQFILDSSRQDLLTEIVTLLNKLENEN